MASSIDYYFSLISPFTYLGHQELLAVATKHDVTIHYKPINLPDVFKTSGALPIPERPASRQAYRLIELQRIAEMRQLPLTLHPKHFPTNPGLANGVAAALAATDQDPGAFVFDVLQAIWAKEQDIADEAVLRAVLETLDLDANSLIADATSQSVTDVIAANTQAAIAAGAVGVPAYVLNGEPFWGQDRVAYLDHALSTGRKPYTAD